MSLIKFQQNLCTFGSIVKAVLSKPSLIKFRHGLCSYSLVRSKGVDFFICLDIFCPKLVQNPSPLIKIEEQLSVKGISS